LKLSELCPFPCHPHQATFTIPPPGSLERAFVFNPADKRHFYAIHPKNHDLDPAFEPHLNPKVAIVGLSAADTQIVAFVHTYARTKSYDKAARDACFKGLANDIILMLEATGAAAQLGLRFEIRDNFHGHADVLCDSLVKCASLTDIGSSTDWKPGQFPIAEVCVTKRFVANMTNPRFTRLKTVIILGDKGKTAVETLKVASGETVRKHLEATGKTFLFFPHPAGGNGEYVALAKQNPLPDREKWIERKWQKYRDGKLKAGEVPDEDKYKNRRRDIWNQVNGLRADFGRGVQPGVR
jgi:hypothetical protein